VVVGALVVLLVVVVTLAVVVDVVVVVGLQHSYAGISCHLPPPVGLNLLRRSAPAITLPVPS